MATFDNKEYVDRIIAANGDPMKYLPADDVEDIKAGGFPEPAVVKIVEYTNMAGRQAWGVIFEGEDLDRYHANPGFIDDPVTIFERKED